MIRAGHDRGAVTTTGQDRGAVTTAGQERGALTVVEGLLVSLDNSCHVASDTAFLFPSGEAIVASRAILATQCSKMIPVLYNNEGILMFHFLNQRPVWFISCFSYFSCTIWPCWLHVGFMLGSWKDKVLQNTWPGARPRLYLHIKKTDEKQEIRTPSYCLLSIVCAPG